MVFDPDFYTAIWIVISVFHFLTGGGLFFVIKYFTSWRSVWQIFSALFIAHGVWGIYTVVLTLTGHELGRLLQVRTITGVTFLGLQAVFPVVGAISLYLMPAASKPTMVAAWRAFTRLEKVND